MDTLSTWDIVVVVGYFIGVFGISIYAMFKHKRNTVDSYFLAGRQMNWLFVGASLFASNIGSEHFIGLAGSGAASGISVGAFELNAMMILQLLGWIFLPVFIASSVATLPEYMTKRFGGNRIRVFLSILSLVLYIFTKISVNLYSGALFINLALQWDFFYSILFILGMTGLSTITGGLAGVIYTDTIQSVIMLAGGATLMGFAFYEVGGITNLYIKYMDTSYLSQLNITGNSTFNIECALPNKNAFVMLRGLGDKDMPWLGFLLGQTASSIWYWCSDQMMVQRTLAAKSLSHAKGGTILAGYLKLLPLFMIVFPGMISRVLYRDEVGCFDPDECMKICGSRNGCTNIAYPTMIMKLMPTGLKGLMLSVMLAALMSDLTSIFNSSSTLFTIDVYRLFRKKASNKELMVVGRVFVIIMVVIGILWVPIIQNMQGGQLYIYIQSVAAYFSPSIGAVYLLAVLWKGINEKGAFWGLLIGILTGVARMILDFVYTEPPCGEQDTRPFIVKDFHYLYFATCVYFITSVFAIMISLCTEKTESYRLIRTTYWTRKLTGSRPDEDGDDSEAEKGVEIELKDKKEITDAKTDKEEVDTSRRAKFWKLFLSLICGIESNKQVEELDKAAERKRRQENVYSLSQTRFERIILNTNLAIILSVASVLFVIFSLPPESLLFKNVNLNMTALSS